MSKKIRMLKNIAGGSGSAFAGQVIEVDDARAADLVAGGYAEEISTHSIRPGYCSPNCVTPGAAVHTCNEPTSPPWSESA